MHKKSLLSRIACVDQTKMTGVRGTFVFLDDGRLFANRKDHSFFSPLHRRARPRHSVPSCGASSDARKRTVLPLNLSYSPALLLYRWTTIFRELPSQLISLFAYVPRRGSGVPVNCETSRSIVPESDHWLTSFRGLVRYTINIGSQEPIFKGGTSLLAMPTDLALDERRQKPMLAIRSFSRLFGLGGKTPESPHRQKDYKQWDFNDDERLDKDELEVMSRADAAKHRRYMAADLDGDGELRCNRTPRIARIGEVSMYSLR